MCAKCEWIRDWRNWRVGDFQCANVCNVMCETFNFIRKTVLHTSQLKPSSFHQLAIHYQNWKLILFISRSANKISWFSSHSMLYHTSNALFPHSHSPCVCASFSKFNAKITFIEFNFIFLSVVFLSISWNFFRNRICLKSVNVCVCSCRIVSDAQ